MPSPRDPVHPQDRNSAFACLLIVILLSISGIEARAQAPAPSDTDMRNRASLLCKQGKFVDALPLLEKLALAHPDDFVILESLGEALVTTAPTATDAAARKQTILRARSLFLRAKELGDKSDYVATMLEKMPENGEMGAFSDHKDVDDAMNAGEAAFGRNDYPAAITAYQRALQLDPTLYHAALFTGDIYFRMNQTDKAGEWFAKAIAIDPDQETAYRYWGDALLKDSKMDEAKEKFIEAVVCEPYQRASWNGLHNWVKANHATISHPQIDLPNDVSGGGKQINITLGAKAQGKKDGSEAWLTYDLARAGWRGDKFKAQFPNEKEYRHSLAEEVDSIKTALTVLGEIYDKPKKRKNIQPSILALEELQNKGMVEPFILISKADNGIAQDYAAYRADHRDKLRQYISEWVIQPDSTKN